MVGSDKERSRAERLAGLVDDAAAAERGGFTAFWMPQVPGYLDALTAVALIGQATERIEIGTAVVPIQTRHPMALAQQALTTQVLRRAVHAGHRALASLDRQRPTGTAL